MVGAEEVGSAIENRPAGLVSVTADDIGAGRVVDIAGNSSVMDLQIAELAIYCIAVSFHLYVWGYDRQCDHDTQIL